MIPVDYVTSMNDYDSVAIVELYTSGSIEITRTNRSGLIDDIFNDCIIERGKR